MNTKQLHYVLTLAKEQSFSAAAAALGISQPALSKYISRLESELGIELFDRSRTPLCLTPKGAVFADTALSILQTERQFYRRIDEAEGAVGGTLTIAVSPFRSIHMMPQVVRRLNEQYPDLYIRLREHVADGLEAAVLDGSCDFAISVLPVDESRFDCIRLGEERIVLAVPKSIARDVGLDEAQSGTTDGYLRNIPPHKLARIPFIVLGENQRLRNMYDAICTLGGMPANRRIEVVNLETAYAMLDAGIGATLLPDIYIANAALREKVCCFHIEHTDEFRTLAAIYRKNTHLTRAAEKAIELIRTLGSSER